VYAVVAEVSQPRAQVCRVWQWQRRVEIARGSRQLRVLLHSHPRDAEVVRDRALARASTLAMDQFAKVVHV
jgi:hypothetical protein